MKRIVLASASPRRQELIRLITDNVICAPSGADETLPCDIAADDVAQYLATVKASSVANDYSSDIVIGCDTVVILDDEILSKPEDEEDAYKKLSSLSGREHKVVTGCAIISGGKTTAFSEVTRVEFYPLTDKQIYDYIATKSPMDKAGGYGIQDKGALFVKGICGDYFNVVGLPVAKLSRYLSEIQ